MPEIGPPVRVELSSSSAKVTWKEHPLLRMSSEVEGSYFNVRHFNEESYDADWGIMSIGDWRGPLAILKFSHHLWGPLCSAYPHPSDIVTVE